jgi:hypothetical protein
MKYAVILILTIYSMWYCLNTPLPDVDLQNKLLKVEKVEDGGCGFMAYYIYQYLEKKGEACEIREYCLTNSPRMHFMVYYKSAFIDAHGMLMYLHPIQLIPYRVIEPDELRRQLNNPKLWNKKFDRSDTTRLKTILNL